MIKLKNNTLFFGVCLIFLLFYGFVYSNYLKNDPILTRDDVLFIFPMKSISSFSEYVHAVRIDKIPDVQPLRDLTFYLNLKFLDLTKIPTFHPTNFILFILSIFLFMKLLEVLNFSRKSIVCSALLYAAHPLMVSSVGWISARKHTLALTFILLLLIDFLKMKKITNKSIVFYLLSILSHQIVILIPVWIIIYSKIKNWSIDLKRLFLMSFLGTAVLFVGIMKTFYLEMGNVGYKHLHWTNNISRYVLSVGRSIIQVIFPISISGDYFQGSILNLIGIPVLIVGVFLLYKSKNNQDSLLWIALAGCIHILTCITFVSDTYLYLPLMCVIISLNYYFQAHPLPTSNRINMLMVAIVFSLLMVKTLNASQMWKSDKALWEYSYRDEGSPYSSILLGTHLLKHDEKLGIEFLTWGANNYDILNHKAIFLSFLETIYKSSLPVQRKIEIYQDCYIDHEIYKAMYALTLLEGTEQQMLKGIEIFKSILKDESNYAPDTHAYGLLQRMKSICKNFPEKRIICHKFKLAY